MERNTVDTAISRLSEVEYQLRAMNPDSLRREPTLPQLLADDVEKARKVLEAHRP